MRPRIRRHLWWLIPTLALGRPVAMHGGVTAMRTDTFELNLAANGQPLSLIRTRDRGKLLATGAPGDGFYLLERGDTRLRLETLSLEGDRLVARAPAGLPAVTFSVRCAGKYIAFRIERLEAVSRSRGMTLHFGISGTRIGHPCGNEMSTC